MCVCVSLPQWNLLCRMKNIPLRSCITSLIYLPGIQQDIMNIVRVSITVEREWLIITVQQIACDCVARLSSEAFEHWLAFSCLINNMIFADKEHLFVLYLYLLNGFVNDSPQVDGWGERHFTTWVGRFSVKKTFWWAWNLFYLLTRTTSIYVDFKWLA